MKNKIFVILLVLACVAMWLMLIYALTTLTEGEQTQTESVEDAWRLTSNGAGREISGFFATETVEVVVDTVAVCVPETGAKAQAVEVVEQTFAVEVAEIEPEIEVVSPLRRGAPRNVRGERCAVCAGARADIHGEPI